MPSVAVCAITFQRPQGLASLLEGFAALDVPAGTEVTFVVVDNDPAGSAAPVVDEWRSRLPGPVLYAVEAQRGIPFARNRAVALAAGRDHVVFVDDDEVPARDWLAELLRVRRETGAAVVTGPVVPVFEREPPDWLRPFFERPRFPDGAEIGYARTSSVLIDAAALPAGEPPFAEKLALTGGSDTHFFMRARAAGHRIAWADRAVVTELFPASRMRVQWVIKREYRRGNTLSLCLRDLNDTWPARAKRSVRAVLEVLRGIALVLTAVGRGRRQALRGVQAMALGAGMLTGLFNVGYKEYAVIHGR